MSVMVSLVQLSLTILNAGSIKKGEGCVMAERNAEGSKQAASRKSLFRRISKGDLVTIHDETGERKGRAPSSP